MHNELHSSEFATRISINREMFLTINEKEPRPDVIFIELEWLAYNLGYPMEFWAEFNLAQIDSLKLVHELEK